MRWAVLALAVGLAACSSNPPPPPPSAQWQSFGANEPTISNGVFAFPTDVNGTAGYFFKQTPAQIGQTLTLNYSITGNNPVWQQHPQPLPAATDINPASITLFLWRQGDNLDCTAHASYRFWFPQRNPLQLGTNQTLSGKLDPNVWTNCVGHADPVGFAAALANALGLGFTFGGAQFYGHGVYLSSGTATFQVNSFTAQ